MINGNGTVNTSSIPTSDIRDGKTFDLMFDNSCLRIGMVVKEYLPNDPQNTSGRRRQYDVLTYTNQGNGPAYPVVYKRAVISTMFGGVADHSEFTLRAAPATNSGKGPAPSYGAVVLLLCINGDSSRSFIIGCSKNRLSEAESSTDGHHLTWEFNGILVNIDNEGQLSIKHRGPTNEKGEVTDVTDNTSSLLFKQDGSVEIVDSKGDRLLVEHGTVEAVSSGDIKVQAQNDIDITSNLGTITTIAGNSIHNSALNEISNTSSNNTIDATVAVNINSPQVIINEGTDPILKANPGFIATFQTEATAALSAASSLINFLGVVQGDPTFSSAYPAVAAAARQPIRFTTAWMAAIAAYQATMSPGVAISLTTRST